MDGPPFLLALPEGFCHRGDMGKRMIVAGIVLLVFLAAIAAIAVSLQSKLAFPFIPVSAQIPGAVKKVGGEVIWLDVNGDQVEAWFLPARKPGAAPLVMSRQWRTHRPVGRAGGAVA